MRWLKTWRKQPYWIESIALSGLLVAIAAAGLVGLGVNTEVRDLTEEFLRYDIELEDRGDDLRVAVLDMRHYHRNITFAGPTRGGLADFEAAYFQLHTQIDRLEELGIRDTSVLGPAQLREMAETYYTEFRPVIDRYTTQQQAFFLASDEGLERLAAIENAARELDQLGEERFAASLRSVEAAENIARAVLLTVLGGLILVGAGLAYLIVNSSREKQQTAAQLSNALQLKNEFIADASHELRTPLTVLRANAEVALELDRSCIHTEFLEEIVQESDRMTRLIEDLLFLARTDSQSMPVELQLVDVLPFLTEVSERARILAHEGGTTLRSELTARGLVWVDATRIEQVVLILVDNAIKYGSSEQPIILRSTTREESLVVEIVDHGTGISEADLPFVFERFYRVDKARSRKQGGTGLGLSIARRIVERHGGRIEVESQLNEGTTMRFYIPLVSVPDRPTANELQTPGKAKASLPSRVRSS